MRPIIQVRNLSKQYRIGEKKAAYGTLRDSIAGAIRNPFRRKGSEENTIWALKDVSFDIMPGEVVGIIGRNGAGKSTLLKILSRITEPTTGEIDIYGRVGSLLEVGTGFHQELSGRENVYLNGAVLGMKRSEIDRKFDEIVDFAEVDKFIDTPVKHYSTGMYMRLAFAVAANLDPEILIVDEVLAVGDSAFQKKCLGKMEDVSKQGRTVVFVSHNMAAVGRLCQKVIWLEKGIMVEFAESVEIITKYMNDSESKVLIKEWPDLNLAPGDEYLRLISVCTLDVNHQPIDIIRQDESFIISIIYRVLQPMIHANIGFELNYQDGTKIFGSYDADNPNWGGFKREPGTYRSECIIPSNLLNEGSYHINFTAGIPFVKLCLMTDSVLKINVRPPITSNGPIGRMGAKRPGLLAPALDWTVQHEPDQILQYIKPATAS